jgi:hypothetical protein
MSPLCHHRQPPRRRWTAPAEVAANLNLNPPESRRSIPMATERCGKQPNHLCCGGVRCLEHVRLYPISSCSGRLNPEGKRRALKLAPVAVNPPEPPFVRARARRPGWAVPNSPIHPDPGSLPRTNVSLTTADAERIATAIEAELAPSTRATYDCAWRQWERSCRGRGVNPSSMPPRARCCGSSISTRSVSAHCCCRWTHLETGGAANQCC